MNDLDEKQLEAEYDERYDKYLLLGEILRDRLNEILKQNGIDYDFIQMRVKSFPSFYEKIFRHGLQDPFKEVEDFCGLRIIHLFDNDLDKVKRIVKREFREIKDIDKTFQNKDPKKHKEREFSYRSYHIIVALKDELLKKNAQLKDLVAEIQIRTICMHAWASIEHKLNYKKQNDFPKNFRPVFTRKFSQMSAMLEVADEIFVSLRSDKNRIIEKYKTDLSKPIKKEKILDDELNIDALQAYLEKNFSKYKQETGRLKYLLEEMRSSGVNLRDIETGERILKDKNLFASLRENYPTESKVPTQTGFVRLILDITNEDFYKLRSDKPLNSKWMKFVDLVKAQLQNKLH
jgi:ppGpp synthetase/RelA/SpoT-type nucleotidyltranferase